MHSNGPFCLIYSSRVMKPPPTLIITLLFLINITAAYVPIIYLHLSTGWFSSIFITGNIASKAIWSSVSCITRKNSNSSTLAFSGSTPLSKAHLFRSFYFSCKYPGLLTTCIFSLISSELAIWNLINTALIFFSISFNPFYLASSCYLR